jgi:carbonic anhydrase
MRTGLDEASLAASAVTDPEQTVAADVQRLLASPKVSDRITAAGYVYDLDTGLVRMTVPPGRPRPA